MLKMVTLEEIRKKYFLCGWSMRRIARELGISRPSVHKALQSAEMPCYHLPDRKPSPVLNPVLPLIQSWLEEDRQAPRKQRHTAHRIYHRLVEEYGFRGGESTIRRAVAVLREKTREVFIPLTADWGEVAEADWGEATVFYQQDPLVVSLFCLKMRRSGVSFVRAYRHCRLESFLDAHLQAFIWLEGVPQAIRYDNLRSAVIRIFLGPQREENPAFSSLRAHYLFDSIFCRPGHGNEKGSVENLVGTVRRNALTPVPQVHSMEELNFLLLQWCQREREERGEDWEKEQAALRPLPLRPFRPAVPHWRIADKMSMVHFDRNSYSVPCRHAHQRLVLWAFPDCLEIFAKGECIALHARSQGRGERIVSFPHILPVIGRKPRSVLHAQAVRALPEPFQLARRRLEKESPLGYREFTKILLLSERWSLLLVAQALEEAMGWNRLTADGVQRLLLRGSGMEGMEGMEQEGMEREGMEQEGMENGEDHRQLSLLDLRLPSPDLSRYDHLLSTPPENVPLSTGDYGCYAAGLDISLNCSDPEEDDETAPSPEPLLVSPFFRGGGL